MTDFEPLPLRLETERLVLTPEIEADAPWFCSLLNARGDHRFTLQEARDRIATMAETISTTGIGALAIRTKGDGEPHGYCAIVVGRASLAEPEIAYELLPQSRGSGYATEASRAMVNAALDTGRRRIWSTVRPWNEPSRRVLKRLGFRQHHVTQDADGEVIWHLYERGQDRFTHMS